MDALMEKRRVALYGGSFNPPHNGHVLAVEAALTLAPIDEVWLLPVVHHPFQKDLLSFSLREALLEAAFSRFFPLVRIESIERELPTPNYSYHTILALQERHPEIDFSFMMGSDTYLERESWYKWESIDRCLSGRIILMEREHSPLPPQSLQEMKPSVTRLPTLPNFSSSAVRVAIHAKVPYWWMLPEGVKTLIQEQGLYK